MMSVRVGAILLAAMCIAACGSSYSNTPPSPTPTPTPAPGGGTTVTIVNGARSLTTTAYSPNPVTVAVGTTVTWTNMTVAPHTVTSDDGTFDSGAANPIRAQGGTFSFKFMKAGTFAYHCQFHTYMKGTIVVK